MLTRRHLLALGAAGAGAALGSGLTGPLGIARARAQGRPLTFASWGGALSDLERDAFLAPFAEERGLEFIYDSPTNYAKIRAMVDAGSPEWDLVDVGGRFIFEGADYLEPLDMSLIPNAKNLDPQWVTEKGIFTSSGATIIAWNTDAFPADEGPKSWADFWDVQRFPGPRGLYKPFYYNYEAALLAAGLSRDEVYPVTKEKVEMALGKLEELRPNVSVWWSAGAQPPQLLSTGELAMSSAWSGRILAVMQEGAPVAMTYDDGIAWGNAWVVVKGSPHAELAMEAINYALDEERQMKLLEFGLYGPTLAAAAGRGSEEQQRWMTTAPQNVEKMLVIDEEQAAAYSADYADEWNRFQLG